jgi:hypothetical protein
LGRHRAMRGRPRPAAQFNGISAIAVGPTAACTSSTGTGADGFGRRNRYARSHLMGSSPTSSGRTSAADSHPRVAAMAARPATSLTDSRGIAVGPDGSLYVAGVSASVRSILAGCHHHRRNRSRLQCVHDPRCGDGISDPGTRRRHWGRRWPGWKRLRRHRWEKRHPQSDDRRDHPHHRRGPSAGCLASGDGGGHRGPTVPSKSDRAGSTTPLLPGQRALFGTGFNNTVRYIRGGIVNKLAGNRTHGTSGDGGPGGQDTIQLNSSGSGQNPSPSSSTFCASAASPPAADQAESTPTPTPSPTPTRTPGPPADLIVTGMTASSTQLSLPGRRRAAWWWAST